MLELYINNQLADIKEETIIAVTKTYESLVNPTLYYADFSKTVTLPVSARNNAIFSNFNRLDSTVTNVGIDPSKKIPYIVLNNKEAVLQGYLHLDNANTVWTDEVYQVTLYSTLGLIFNEMKLLTFNKNVSDLDPKYIIESPISDDLVIDRNLVKSSFEQQTHILNSDLITDWIGFIPTYQGFYSNFSSDKEQIFPEGRVDEMPTQRDEHYRREFRSYYQQPFIWVDKLWKCAKDSIERITDYTLRLDRSWFNQSNPYYRDLIYTCPNLFTSDSNFKSLNQSFQNQLNVEMFEKGERTQVPLSTPTNVWLQHLTPNETTDLYDDGIFNPNADMGGTQFKGKLRTVICAAPPQDGGQFAKIKKSNPFIVTVKAVRASDGTEIQGARKKFLLYSCDHNISSNSYDEAIDLGISDRSDADVSVPVTQRPLLAEQGYHETGDGYWWEVMLEFTLNVTENTPYKVVASVGNFNNDEPFEFASGVFGSSALVPRWDWVWVDFFSTGLQPESGYDVYFDAFDCEASTQENLRSFSNVSLYRIFPKDTTLCDVILNYSKMFGLVWTVDETAKEVSVMTRNRFYDDYRIVDWTDKIDRSNDFVFNPLNFDKRYVTFNFDEGKCGRLERYEDMYNYTYGSKKLDTGYEFNSDENKLFEKITPSVIAQKRQYSQMYNTTNPNAANFMGYSYMVYPEEHYVDNDKEGANAGMSGAFYFRNGTFNPDSRLSLPPSDSRYFIILTDDTTHQIQTGDYCWNICGENMTLCYKLPDVSTISRNYGGKRYSVHFEAPKEYFFDPAIYGNTDIKYIYANYWQDYINERYCTQNKKLTAYIYITPDEFADIDFREFVKIDNILYHIDKVYDYDFNANNPVKMDLVQVWDLSAYTEGQGDFPYLFTEEESIIATTTAQTLTVYASGDWTVAGGVFTPNWISASNVDGDLQISATSTTDTYREGTVTLQSLVGDMMRPLLWTLRVVQYPSTQHRLDTELHTVVFDGDGGTERLSVDCSSLANNTITVTTNKSWLTASIPEYSHSIFSLGRLNLHLDITAQPNTFIRPRNGVVTLSATLGGMSYTTIVNVGQQGAETHPRIFNTDIITHEYGLEEGLSVLDGNNTPVDTLISGTTYHFTDLFPEEIDINSLAITNGTVNITGNAGEQVVTFTPQLVNGNEVGGGAITAKTLDGKDLCYNYDLYLSEQPEPPTPTPPEPDPGMEKTYFFVEDISGADNTLSIRKSNTSAPTISVLVSTDTINWSSMGSTSTTAITATIPANGRLYLKATTNAWGNSANNFNVIKASANHNVGGNIMSLLYGVNFIDKTTFNNNTTYNFTGIFSGDSYLISARNLVLPATKLVQSCYSGMFENCTRLTIAPKLPATTLAISCYYVMFYFCSSLTTAPALPAIIMYRNCYQEMFERCESLTTAPELPARSLVNYCYNRMFQYCTKLNKVITYASNISATGCVSNWLGSVASTGDFYNLGSATYERGGSGIPTRWTEHREQPTPPTPPVPVVYNRLVTIKATDGGLFRISINGNVIKSTDYWQEKVIDGTDIKLMALPKDGYAFSLWKDSRGNEYTTTTINFTVDQSLEDEDGNIIYYPYFKEGVEMVTVNFNAGTYGGQTQPYITIGSDSTHYTTVSKTVPKGTVIGSVEAHGTEAFKKWSDGSTANPRDYIANANTTITALYTTATAFDITADGSGLSGVNDSVLVYVNGTQQMAVGKDLTDNIPLADDTYTIKTECRIADNNSKFNTFVVDGVTSTDNPYTFTTNTSKTIQVTTVPSAVYYTEDTGANYYEELKPQQDWLLDGVFRSMPIEKEVWVPSEVEYGEMTLAIPTDYNIMKITDQDGNDIMEEFQIEKSDSGEWWLLYKADTKDFTEILFALELA